MAHADQPAIVTLPVGQRIRRHRLDHQLTQTELARQIGIQQSDLSRMEKGEYRVSLDVLFRILQALELSLGEFFGDLAQHSLTSREGMLLESFRVLPHEAQQEVIEFVDFKRRREEDREPRS
jgi:transcriptional regulator with XRE-family HTH domain